MATNNPIDMGIRMADRTLAAFGIVPAKRPAAPKPTFTVKAQLERSLVFEQIAEEKAKLETFRAQEAEFREILCAEYGSMAYEAENAKFKMETRTWKDGVTLNAENRRVEAALDAHNNCLEEIDSLERSIEDAQNDLDDAELWEQVVSA